MIDWNYIVSQIATVAFDILYFLRPESASGAYNRTKELRPLVEETYGGILGAGLFRYSL